ncbi:MAG: hypothetical protein A2Y15_03165 [Clostridiales bacterium GWF2_36_10]|nr:MAG: hypothetical protein A2Y15_03165 [Clostridiales bacterium GWF2_36_10]HAN20972.1 hypothetical protein [Clostridiales bacterium]
MIKKFFLLVKTNLSLTFNPKRMLTRQNKPASKGKSTLYAFLMLFMFVYFLGISSTLFYGLGKELNKIGYIDLLIFLAVISYTAFILIITVFSAQGYLFKSKDLPLLLSLPVSHFSVLLSKFILLYIYELFFSVLFIGPAFYFYFYFTSFSVLGIIGAVICFFASPFIPLSIGSLFSFLLGLITRRMRKKNFFTIFMSLAFVVVYFYIMQNGQSILQYIFANSEKLKNTISLYYSPSVWVLGGLNGEVLKAVLYFILGLIAVFIIFIIISGKYSVIVSILNSSGVRRRNKEQKYGEERSSALSAMIKKELSFYFSSSNYVLNTIIGPALLVLASAAFLFMGADKIAAFAELGDVGEMSLILASALTIFMPSLSSTTSASISLEGKKLWIYKSIPALTKDILKAKTAVNLIITIPAIIVSDILLCIALELGILDYFLLITLGISFVTFFSITGLLINLSHPKLDFENEIVVIKQSMSVILQMLTTFGIMAVCIISYTVLKPENIYLFALTVILIIIVLIALLSKRLFTWGVKRFNEL